MLHVFFPSLLSSSDDHRVVIIQCVDLGLASLSNMNIKFLHGFFFFHGFIAPFKLSNTPLSEYSTVYPFTYLRTSLLLLSVGNYD